MTFQQISQRGKEYLKAGQTVFRAVQTMTDLAIACQLKALADDCQRLAEKEPTVQPKPRGHHIKSGRIEGLNHALQ